MTEVTSFPFDKQKFGLLKEYHFGQNWPVVYILEDKKEIYIGQTTNVYIRSKQHYEKPERSRLKSIHILTDAEFNLSSAYDFESLLIQYIAAEGTYKLQNGNWGLVNHNYYDREKYLAKLEIVWDKLREIGLVDKQIRDLQNSEFFKYSPYKGLVGDQAHVAKKLVKQIKKQEPSTYLIKGGPGTGKSILAVFLLKKLADDLKDKSFKPALVIPMTSLRSTLKNVIRRVPGLNANMVIGPNDVAKGRYDLLIVDEAHRLRRRVNLTNYRDYDVTSKKIGLDKNATQLDWILASANQHVLFYDSKQTITAGDVRAEDFDELGVASFELTSQMRVEGGEDYIKFVDDLLALKLDQVFASSNYNFKFYENIHHLVRDIKEKDSKHKLARLVAGFAWPWATKGGKEGHDIEIDGLKLKWNSTNIDWVNSKNAVNEVGCIHTIQGYDLNYAGVIIGPEVSYDEVENRIVINEKLYLDPKGRQSITEPEELKRYIINIYKTLLTRGIKGTYLYVVDDKLRERFKKLLSPTFNAPVKALIKSPLTIDMIEIPLVGSAPCGNPLLAEENIQDYIFVEKSKIKPGFEYFVLRAEGDSMNMAGINDGDLVLCRQQLKAQTGDRVVALLGGENVTIKEYGPRENGIRLLIPRSTNRKHKPIAPENGDSVQGVVQEVLPNE